MKKIKHYNIMLVEDEELLRQSLARHIDALDNGYKVVCQAMDGQEALEAGGYPSHHHRYPYACYGWTDSCP